MIVTIEINEEEVADLLRYIGYKKILWDMNYCTPSVAEKIACKVCDECKKKIVKGEA